MADELSDAAEASWATLTPEAKALYIEALVPGWVSAVDPEEVPGTRELLLRLGLLVVDGADASRLLPVDPQLAQAAIRRRLQSQAVRLEDYGAMIARELAVLSSFYDQMQTTRPTELPLEELVGLAAIRAAIDEAVRGCSTEALTAQPGSRSGAALTRALARAEPLLARGVRLRSLYQHPTRFSEAAREYAAKAVALGAEIRTMDEIPSRLMIFDRKVAVVSASRDMQRAVIVRERALVNFISDTFERDWCRASPFETRYQESRPGQELNMVQQSIMRLLVEGVTDDAIARRLNLNVRTCRMHIAKIIKAYGAQTRVQAAYLMGRSEAASDGAAVRGESE